MDNCSCRKVDIGITTATVQRDRAAHGTHQTDFGSFDGRDRDFGGRILSHRYNGRVTVDIEET